MIVKKKKTRKLYNFKQFENLFISSSAFNTLKVLRSKRQLTRYFNLHSFDLSSVEQLTYSIQSNTNDCLNFVKDCENISVNNTQVFIKLNIYVNSLICYAFIRNTYSSLKKDTVLENDVKRDLWTRIRSNFNLESTPSLQHRLDLNFFDLYMWLSKNENRLTNFVSFVVRRSQKNRVLKGYYSQAVNSFQAVFDYLEWDYSKLINQDYISGLWFRKNELISFYKGIDYKKYLVPFVAKNNYSVFYSGLYNDLNDLFILRKFCRLHTARSSENNSYSIDTNYDYDRENDSFGQYITSKETVVFNYDSKVKNDYPSINLMSNNNRLRDYSFKIASELPFAFMPYEEKHKDNLLYLGLEIECNKSARCPTNIIKMLEEKILSGTAVAKHDGSLGHRGLELNIVPMTLDFAKQTDYYFKFEKQVKDYLNSYRDYKTGIHIHVPRKLFTNYQIGQLVQFMNKRSNYDYICSVGGRLLNDQDNSYATTNSGYDISHYNKNRYNLNRTSAINVTLEKTLEFRVFKGNLSAKTIYRYLEFIHSLCTYIKSNSCSSATDVNDYLKWVSVNHSDYAILNEFNARFTKSAIDKTLRPIESFELRYKKRFNNVSYNIPTLKLATPLRLKSVRAVNIREYTPQTSFNFESQSINLEINNNNE